MVKEESRRALSPCAGVFLLLTLLTTARATAQELAWSLRGSASMPTINESIMELFWNYCPGPDSDQDGFTDVMVHRYYSHYIFGFGTSESRALQVRSAIDGRVLRRRNLDVRGVTLLAPAGDRNGDGQPDYLVSRSTRQGVLGDTSFFSWDRGVTGYLPGISTSLAEAELDVDGDGALDVVLLVGQVLEVRDAGLAVLYTIPPTIFGTGFTIRDIAAVDDVDGDGATDFLVLASANTSPSYTAECWLFSGATGTILRRHTFVRNVESRDVARLGDLDADGWADYGIQTDRVEVFSGITGSPLASLTNGPGLIGWHPGGNDVDLDGYPDVIGTTGAVSSRTWTQFASWPGGAFPGFSGAWSHFLPASPGGTTCFPHLALGGMLGLYGGVDVYRLNPPGSAINGNGCSSTGTIPSIGIRRTPTGHHLQAGSAPPGYFAFCVLDPAGSLVSPLPLDPLGFGGCTAYVNLGLVLQTIVGATGLDAGYAGFDQPRLLSVTGVPLESQWLFLDFAGGYALTPRLEYRVL